MKQTKNGRATVTYVVQWRPKGKQATVVRRITVPATWRVTLGVVLRGAGGGAQMLRFYEGTLQRLCLAGVTQFWDESVKIGSAPEYEGLEKLSGVPEVEPLPSF